MSRDIVRQLTVWLENQSSERYGASRTHDLHLWDWEVDALLAQLQELAK